MEGNLNPEINKEGMTSTENRPINKDQKSSEFNDRPSLQNEISHKRKYDCTEDNLSHKMRANLRGEPYQTKLSLHGMRSEEFQTSPPQSSTAVQIN